MQGWIGEGDNVLKIVKNQKAQMLGYVNIRMRAMAKPRPPIMQGSLQWSTEEQKEAHEKLAKQRRRMELIIHHMYYTVEAGQATVDRCTLREHCARLIKGDPTT